MALKRKPAKYLVIDGCPCPRDVAPYVYLVLRRAGQTANSIYRGSDPAAAPILARHGKHTQAQMASASPAIRASWGITGNPNPAGRSTHELKNDGVAYGGTVGRSLEPWQVGVDSGSNTHHDVRMIQLAAAHYGLRVMHPYSSGVEEHHWNFRTQPRPDGKHLTKTRVILTRAKLALAR